MFRYYRGPLKQLRDPLPSMDDVVEFIVRNNANELEKNLKQQGLPSGLQDNVKEVVTDYWYVFCEY